MKIGDKVYIYPCGTELLISFITEVCDTCYYIKVEGFGEFNRNEIFPYTDSGQRRLLKRIDQDIKALQEIRDNIDED